MKRDVEQVTLYIGSGKRVDLENHTVVVAVPVGGKKEIKCGGIIEGYTIQDYEFITYKYATDLQGQMEKIAKRKYAIAKVNYITAVVDVRRKVILEIK